MYSNTLDDSKSVFGTIGMLPEEELEQHALRYRPSAPRLGCGLRSTASYMVINFSLKQRGVGLVV